MVHIKFLKYNGTASQLCREEDESNSEWNLIKPRLCKVNSLMH